MHLKSNLTLLNDFLRKLKPENSVTDIKTTNTLMKTLKVRSPNYPEVKIADDRVNDNTM